MAIIMKTPQQAALNYGNNGGSATSAQLWAGNWSGAIPTMKTNAAAKVSFWQSQVSTQQAAANFTAGVQSFDATAATNKANGAGKSSFQAGVQTASKGKYLSFAGEFLPAVSTIVQNLNRTNPRGTKLDNRTRLNAYLDALEAQAGSFKQ